MGYLIMYNNFEKDIHRSKIKTSFYQQKSDLSIKNVDKKPEKEK